MASINKEWTCKAHGDFEATVARCPHGCSGSSIERRFFTPVGIGGDRTKNIDRTLEAIASDYGLSDMNNDGGRGAAMPRRQAPDFTPQWGSMTPGGTYVVGKGVVGGVAGGGAPAAVTAAGGRPDNALANITNLPAPRPMVVGRHNGRLDTGGAE